MRIVKKMLGLCLVVSLLSAVSDKHYPFVLPKLGYEYKDLEPYIDEATMRVHYECHFTHYLEGLNDALKNGDALHRTMSLEDLLTSNSLPKSLRKKVRDSGGGFANHKHYFAQFSLAGKGQSEPTGDLLKAITKQFKSVDNFKKKFNQAAMKLFGSGWVWLVKKPNGSLKIITKANQDTPLKVGKPIIGLDMWEHAYYLKHNCKKADYVKDFWNVLDWKKIEDFYSAATKN